MAIFKKYIYIPHQLDLDYLTPIKKIKTHLTFNYQQRDLQIKIEMPELFTSTIYLETYTAADDEHDGGTYKTLIYLFLYNIIIDEWK